MALENLEPNDEFFRKILHRGMKDDTIQDVVLVEKKPAVKKGENYMSDLTRFTLKYTCNVPKGLDHGKVHKVAHLIMKEEPDASEQTLELIRKTDIFNTERVILEEVVPRIEELIGKRLGPKVYYSSIEPQTIVMEDLVALGFKNKNRKGGLNEQQVFMVLENLADFHAASVSLNEHNPQFVSRFKNGMVNAATSDMFFHFLRNGLKSIADSVRTWPGKQFAVIGEKLLERTKDIEQRMRIIYQCDEDELRVLNHGDLWVNNIMIRDDENGEAEAARFVDYQMSIWTSPAIDLLYFLCITPEPSIKITHDDIFLQKYLARLSSTMRKLDCFADAPTLEQLKKSMHKRRAFALMATFVFWPKMLAEEEDVEAIDEIVKSGKSKVNPLKYPQVQEVMEKVLPILDKRGYLD